VEPRAIELTPAADSDSDEAYSWYEAQESGAGRYFDRRLIEQLKIIAVRPFSFPPSHVIYRKALLKKFPYAIYFQVFDEKVLIVAIVHSARNPERIQRLLNRKF
jgi:plasmid stabilization system protein ParE